MDIKKIGDKVTHFTGIEGMITAIFYRVQNTYEFTYCNDGEIVSRVVEECEISLVKTDKVGFNGNSD